MTRHRFDRKGLLAIEPKAFFFLFDEPELDNKRVGNAEVVNITGPLDHHAGWWCDSYDEILERVDAACASDATHVILKIDSPGGVVFGCFDTARAIRAKCKAAGKTLIAYVDGQACSAAYALASAAERIVVPDTGIVGSIGVIDTRVDLTGMDASIGVKFAFITSGARKADGHPHLPISKEELAETQAIVDAMASVFFELVAEHRGLKPSELAALDARVFPGASALEVGLADEVGSFADLLSSIEADQEEEIMSVKDARKALEKAAKGEGAEAEMARRALASMGAEEPKDEEENPESEGEENDEENAESEDDEENAESEDDEEEATAPASNAGAVSASTAGDLAATVSHLSREVERLKALNEKAEKKAFLASRPDLSPELRKVLAGKPLAEVKAIVNAIPKPKAPKHAAAVAPTATRGETNHGDGDLEQPAETEADRIDRVMGLQSVSSTGVINTPHVQILGAPKVKKG